MFKSVFVGLAFAACAFLAACAGDQQPGGEPIAISKEANDHLQNYLKQTQAGRMGAFAVSTSGGAAYYSICESGGCNGQYNFSAEAIRGCEKFGRGRCVVLASNGVIKRAYKVDPSVNNVTAETLQQMLEQVVESRFATGERIREALSGNSIVQTNSGGEIWAEYYDPNGMIRGRNWDGAKFAGTWKVDARTLCVDYDSVGEDWCGQFIEGDDGSIAYYKDGKFQKTYPKSVLKSGNPQEL
jgi:hypothetical protein